MTEFDVIIVGSGPGGYVTAIRASQLGLNTAIVEKEALGGVCLNWGCIPTKALLRSAEILHLAKHSDEFGVELPAPKFKIEKAVKRSRDVAARLSGGVSHLMKKNKITVIKGHAVLRASPGVPIVEVESDNGSVANYRAEHVILASGARARELPDIGLSADEETVLTYRGALVPKSTPKTILVIGSGAIGIEFASFFNEAGSNVTVVELEDRILPAEDPEISKLAKKSFESQNIAFHTSSKVVGASKTKSGVLVEIEVPTGERVQLETERVLLAVGIVANSDGMGLEALGVNLKSSHVVVDEYGRTNVAGLYAIGDLTGPPWLAHKASHEGIVCIERIAGKNPSHPFDTSNIPGCTYSHPQIASIGLTEPEAVEAGFDICVGRFPFLGNGKAIALGDDDGLIKTIFDKETGALLGAHMIGPDVTELIQGYVIAREGEMTEEELMRTVFPHPTLSEGMHEAVLEAFDRVIHI